MAGGGGGGAIISTMGATNDGGGGGGGGGGPGGGGVWHDATNAPIVMAQASAEIRCVTRLVSRELTTAGTARMREEIAAPEGSDVTKPLSPGLYITATPIGNA